MFSKLLIANRGEIACRVIATARRLGIATVAVYSDGGCAGTACRPGGRGVADRPPPARESYLDDRQDHRSRATEPVRKRSIPATAFCRRTPDFAEACAAAGIVFIGPPRCRDPRHGIEVSRQSVDGARRRAAGARLPRRGAGRAHAGSGGGAHWLPCADQGQSPAAAAKACASSNARRTCQPPSTAQSARRRFASATTRC